jgi:hypothetical protein
MRAVWLVIGAAMALGGCASTPGGLPYPGRRPDVVVVGDRDRSEARGPRKLGKIPPGHYPPPGECRLWYPGRPPGHQPAPTRCAALIGRLPRDAFILYNGAAWDAGYDWRWQEKRKPGSVPRVILELVQR